jgi:alpha-D-xyloside xylohydrolase
LRKQIPAGLGFSISGVPYWTLDSGGFSVPHRFADREATAADVDEWRELATRWFEYATFLPLLRVHGQWPKREMWEYGGDNSPAFRAQLKFDRLRYRLLPYIYSLAGAVTQEGATIMRPLVMAFRTDARARAVTDQYLFGPAFLVSPVTTYSARARTVLLPNAPGGWYDFWTGTAIAPGTITAPSPFDAIPVHVRAGSLIPIGPELQYTSEKPAETITLYIYAGADGSFTLYEDEGVNDEYERGMFARIPLRWTDATRTLTLGARQGSFSGMLERRRFQLILVTPNRAVPFSFDAAGDKTVKYVGTAMDIKL